MFSFVLSTACCHAISGTTPVAWPGRAVAADSGWPEGALELINDSLRTHGWNPWFSELPNDVNHYAFDVRGSNDVNRLIAKLDAIKAPEVQIRLSPEAEPGALGFTTALEKGNGAAVLFTLGNQRRLNEWFGRLPESQPGVRKFGVGEYTNVPAATLPTLTLYVGNPAIDLDSLKIPDRVRLVADTGPVNGIAKTNVAVIRAIEEFVQRHGTNSVPRAR